MKVKLTEYVEKIPDGYQGYITAYIGKCQLWIKRSGIVRLDNLTAYSDAKQLKSDCLSTNLV